MVFHTVHSDWIAFPCIWHTTALCEGRCWICGITGGMEGGECGWVGDSCLRVNHSQRTKTNGSMLCVCVCTSCTVMSETYDTLIEHTWNACVFDQQIEFWNHFHKKSGCFREYKPGKCVVFCLFSDGVASNDNEWHVRKHVAETFMERNKFNVPVFARRDWKTWHILAKMAGILPYVTNSDPAECKAELATTTRQCGKILDTDGSTTTFVF